MPSGRRRLGGLLVVLVVVPVVFGVAAVVLWSREGDQATEPPLEASEAFLERWESSRRATFATTSLFERTPARGGTALSATVRTVQRPPDRLVAQMGGITGSLDGRSVTCDDQPRIGARCTFGSPGYDYEAEIGVELSILRSYFEGRFPVYEATVGEPGCFDLRLVRAILSPPYGHNARFCFDERTSAPTLVRIERREATDVTSVVDVSDTVSEADFDALIEQYEEG